MRSFSPRSNARHVSLLGACVLLAATVLPAALWAQGGDVTTVAVVRFTDMTARRSSLLEAKATDAVALALSDSKEYLVTPAREVDREVQALALNLPLSMTEAVRLGKRLDVDCVCLGQVLVAAVNTTTGKGEVRLQIMMVDVEAAELLDGSTVTTQTKPIPGWSGTEADILNEALRQSAEEGVARMLATRVRRGSVDAVLPTGTCAINLGSEDGAASGMKLVVMRPVYLKELETVTLRKIGYLEVSRMHPDMCYADPVRNVAPRTGDYVVRVYEPQAVVIKEAAKQDRTKFVWGLASLALLGALAGIATGGNEGTKPPTPISYLYQDTPGVRPTIRVEFLHGLDKAFGHLLFRGPIRYFPADPYYLVEVSTRGMGEERIRATEDLPDWRDQRDVTITVTFRDESGDYTTETVDITYMHPQLDPGSTYYHRIQRVTKPQFPPGTNPPIGSTGGTEQVAQAAGPDENVIDQSGDFPMLSQASDPAGPVTYIEAPTLSTTVPQPGVPQNTASIDFEWSTVVGADDYMLEVYDANGTVLLRRTGIRPTPPNIRENWRPAAGDLAGQSTYYWHVGARKKTEVGARGQGIPQCGAGSNLQVGYVLSSEQSFVTAPIPPGPVGTTTPVAGPGKIAAKPGKQANATAGDTKPAKGGGKPGRTGGNAPPRPARPPRTPVWQPAPTVGPGR